MKPLISLEQLEIDKLWESKNKSSTTSEYDELYEGIKQDNIVRDALKESEEENTEDNNETNEEESTEGESTPEEGNNESSEDNTGTSENTSKEEPEDVENLEDDNKDDTSTEEPKEDTSEVSNEDKELKAAQESLTYSLALEDGEGYAGYEDISLTKAGSALWGGTKFVGSNVVSLLLYLKDIGVKYGPDIAKTAFTGVIIASAFLVKALITGGISLSKYLERRKHSFENTGNDIESLRRAISALKENEEADLSDYTYTNEKVINMLKAGSSVDFTKNISEFSKFIDTYINSYTASINDEVGSIRHLISISSSNLKINPLDKMKVDPIKGFMSKGDNDAPEGLTEYVTKEHICGDAYICAYLPTESISDVKELGKIYKKSEISVEVNNEIFHKVDSVDYMTLDELDTFVNKLDELNNLCLKHKYNYDSILNEKRKLKFNFKNYINSFLQSKEKKDLGSTLVNYVYLKTLYIDKVFIKASIELHDYAIKVITAGLTYSKDVINKKK